MSRSFKKNAFGNDLFPMPRKFAKKNLTRKIRRGTEIKYADTKIIHFRDFIKPENCMDNFYNEFLRK